MNNVYVIGIGQTIFGKHGDLTTDDLGAYAANEAIKDAGIEPKDIQSGFCAKIFAKPTSGQSIFNRVGVSRVPIYNVENACASGSSAIDLLSQQIALGIIDCGIAVGVESMSMHNRKAGKGLLGAEDDMDGALGLVMPGYFATMYQRLMSERGATIEDLCYPTIKNHKNSVNNPLSQYHKELTFEEVMASPMIVDPITTLQCCPQSDGGAAVILCSEAFFKKHGARHPAVKLAASVISSCGPDSSDFDPIEMPCMVDGARKAYEMANVGPEDLDLIELHDAFSGEEMAAYEMLGLCKKGDCVKFVRDHSADIGGICAINPSGGLLSMGHPLGASGVRVVNDVVRQLRGEAYGTQIPNARIGMAQMLGGVLTGQENPLVAGIEILIRVS